MRGVPVPLGDAPPTRCDALQTKLVSPLTLAALRANGAKGATASEEAIEEAIAYAFRHLRLVVEPGGAIALAAALSGTAGPLTERTVIILSGGNIDPALYTAIIGGRA